MEISHTSIEAPREAGEGVPLRIDPGAPLDLPEVLEIAIGLTAALGEVHRRGLVHNDVRPANVLIDGEGTVRLTGIGPSEKSSGEHQLTGTNMALEALAYMAPERTGRMNRPADSRSDLYSLGVGLYQMLTGDLPFTANDPLELIHGHVARAPHPPAERNSAVPEAVERIVLKLLGKSAQDRYQTAAGLEHDLRLCLDAWQADGRIEPFDLATNDRPDRPLMPGKLYGRETQTADLRGAFERVAARGAPELVLISGYAGVGKSALVAEFQSTVAGLGGMFAAGKAEQYMRGAPYAPLAAAIQGLVRGLLSRHEEELERWRLALLDALGANGQLMVDLAPDLALIVGNQTPVPALSPHDEKGRFQLVLRAFLGVFAQPGHPLTLFLDDLQWLDSATLDLLERLMLDTDVKHLLIVGAYRPNEVDGSDRLSQAVEAIGTAGGAVLRIPLNPLDAVDLKQLVADALRCDPDQSAPLAQLLHEKTGGNPFFVVQLLTALADEALLTFGRDEAAWRWDAEAIRAKAISDNVADLMAEKLRRLPQATVDAAKQLASLGKESPSTTLGLVLGTPQEDVHAALAPAISEGLIVCSNQAYAFIHDRVQEAAYALIPDAKRPAEHLRIGRTIWASASASELAEHIFEIVDHLVRGASLIQSPQERVRIAELNLLAARRARASTAFDEALTYAEAGSGLLAGDIWSVQYRLAFDLELLRAECEFLTGELGSAAERLSALSGRASGLVDVAAVTCLRMGLYTTLAQPERAIAVGLEFLRLLGVDWSPHPTAPTVARELDATWRLLAGRPIEALLDLPVMEDPERLALAAVLAEFLAPATFSDNNLFELVVLYIANLSIEHGNCDGSPFAYALLNIVLGLSLGDYKRGLAFGQLACDLVDTRGLDRFKGRVYMAFGTFVLPWTKPLATARVLLRRATDIAVGGGDLTYEGYARLGLMSNLMSSGEPLADVQRDAEEALAFARKAHFGLAVDCFTEELFLIRDLSGRRSADPAFEGTYQDRAGFERHLEEGGPSLAAAAAKYWIHRVQACFFAGDAPGGVAAMAKIPPLLWSTRSFVELVEYHFYGALALALACNTAPTRQRRQHLDAIAAHRLKLAEWAEACPENCAHRELLIAAEIARLEARDLDAQRLFEDAVQVARRNGFLPHEGIANELAAQFHAAQGLDTIADAYLRNARSCYLRWGADGKVRQLEQRHPHLRAADSPGAAPDAAIDRLDVAAVVQMSQAVSGELVLDDLVEKLMTIVIEHAGAVRGLLFLPRDGEMRVVAEAVTDRDAITVNQADTTVASRDFPVTVLNYVVRTHQSVLLDDAVSADPHSAEAYVVRVRPRSVLCLPLMKQGQLIGVLYLENTLSAHVFTPERASVLNILAGQAAISIENANLYRDLHRTKEQARRAEQELRRSFDMIPALAWTAAADGRVEFANQQWHDFTGIAPEALSDHWSSAFHPDDTEKIVNKWMELLATGSAGEVEARMLRPDGAVRSFLVRAAPMRDENGAIVKWIGVNTDIDDLKRAEEAQEALARAGRLTAMGELTVSITHEVNQPLMAIVTNAATCLRWLSDGQLDVREARIAAERIVRDGHRAGDVIASIRRLARKSPPAMVRLEINTVIGEVLALVQSEMHRRSITLDTNLAPDVGSVLGDPVRMQQVILNLVMNGAEAIGATQGKPRQLEVRTRSEEAGHVLVSVVDTGEGVDMETPERIFDAFFTTKPEGLGMGLSICRSIVEAHGGRLWASPNTPQGSVFHFTIPTVAEGQSFDDVL